MNALEPGRSPRRPLKRRRRNVVRPAILALLAVLVFLLGVAFAKTLDERPSQGDTVTMIGTLPPSLEEGTTHTVTVTVTVTRP